MSHSRYNVSVLTLQRESTTLKREHFGFGRKGIKLGHFGGSLAREFAGRLSRPKRELLGWKHPRAQNVGEERLAEDGDEGGEDGTSLRYFSLLFPF